MILSTRKIKPKFVDGVFDKTDAMFQAVRNFKRHNVETLDDLYNIVDKNCVYSPVYFNNNYRMQENAILTIDLLIFDIDKGTTMNEVLNSKLGQTWEIMLLKTVSWSPQLEKFRVFIPLKEPLTFNNVDEYREFYKVINEYFNFNADLNTMEAGRGYINLKDKEALISAGTKWLNLTKASKKIMQHIRRQLLREKILREKQEEALKTYRIKHNIKVPTPSDINQEKKFREATSKLGPGEKYSTVFSLLSYCKFRGQTAQEAAQSVLLLNIGGEYSDTNDLMKKYKRAK